MRQKAQTSTIKWSRVAYVAISLIVTAYFMWIFALLYQSTHKTINSSKVNSDNLSSAPTHPSDNMDFKSPEATSPLSIVLSPTRSPIETVEKETFPPFPAPIAFASFDTPPPDEAVMVVGGTDGSGTRRVVQILSQLGVTMVSEDPETYDIHADLVGGWPEVVRPVLRETHSLNYDPGAIYRIGVSVGESLKHLLDQVQRDSVKPTSHRLAVGGALPKPPNTHASKVAYGFKAPVAMTLSPWWAHLLPHCKILHVLRDGRDIAFSANQGPVEKFYVDMYGASGGTGKDSTAVKAIRLWSDWNSQLYRWAAEFATKQRRTDTGQPKSFSYLAVHSEDLVSSVISVRFAAVSHLAEFVGSSLSEEQLCCIAMVDAEFMGSHDRSVVKPKDAEAQLARRYGKWHSKLEGNQQLRESIYEAGSEGLKVFGYDPARDLADDSMASKSGFRCIPDEHRCAEDTVSAKDKVVLRAEDWTIPGMCETVLGVDYKGGEIAPICLKLHGLTQHAEIQRICLPLK